MEYAYSIIMACFAAALLLYAGLMAISKDYKMLPLRMRHSFKSDNSKEYMTGLSKVIALVALSPALSALTGLWNKAVAAVVLIVSMIIFIWLGTRIMKDIG